MAVEVGEQAPDFELENQYGEKIRLSDYRGDKHVVLMFFPKAFTGICTAELCAIRDEQADFRTDDVEILSISCDTAATQKAFAEQQQYEHFLLSDFWPHGEVAKAYGVFIEERGFPYRGTFIIDKDGVVRWKIVNSPADARSNDDYRLALKQLV